MEDILSIYKTHYFIIGILFFVQLMGYALLNTSNKGVNFLFGGIFGLATFVGAYYLMDTVYLHHFILFIGLPVGFICFFIGTLIKPSKQKNTNERAWSKHDPFVLEHAKGKMKYYDAFDNFMLLAGANSGKTKSYGRPLLREYIKNNFAGFIFDYKDQDYTKTAYYLVNKYNYPYKFYYVNFTNLNTTYRFNPISPSVLGDKSLLPQLMTDLLTAYLSKDAKKDEWFDWGVGVLKAVSMRFYKDYPQQCTIPHIFLFLSLNSSNFDALAKFIEKDPQATALAGGFLSASEKQKGSILSSVTGPIGNLTANEKICYVLSGNDFNFNLINPQEPKLFAVSSSYKIEDELLPVISMMFKISSRAFDMENRIPFVYFMDEGTTLKIHKFESMPSVLREYGASFSLITQSEAKIVMTYDENTLRSLKANFGNVLFGKTTDPKSQANYVKMFSKIDKVKISESSSRGEKSTTRGTNRRVDREAKYEESFFSRLKAGEFVGSSINASQNEYHYRFNMMEQPKDIELPIVRNVTDVDVQKNYEDIINFVKLLV